MRFPVRVPLLILAATLLLEAAPAPPSSTVVVTDLRCEYRENPIGVDERQPRLGWILTSSERDQEQSAYQVLVASSLAALDNGRGELWDSGKVTSSQSVQVVYSGKSLTSRSLYYWKLRVWDARGRISPWSAPARWEMALVAPSDWSATWLNDGKPNPRSDEAFYVDDPAPLFRRDFSLPAPVSRARLYITGLGYYEASLNGTRVGDRMLDPGWTTYGRRVFYSAYDVTGQIRQGLNCIGVMVGNGWYNPLPLRMWGHLNLRDHLTVGRPRFIAQLEVDLADGSRQTIVSDPRWKVTDGPLTFNSIYLGERYDARRELDGWNQPGFDDRTWHTAAHANEPVGPLQAQPQPPIRVTATLAPTAVTEPAPGVFIFDLGQNFAGLASLSLRAPVGTKVTLRYGELLNADGTLNPLTGVAGQIKGRRRTPEGGSENIGGAGSPEVAWPQDSYVARGSGLEVYTQRFTFHGCRYVEVTGYPGTPPRDSVKGLRMGSDVAATGSFESSDDLLNRIQTMTRWTFLSNLFSVQSDCPHRERFGYGGDIVATSDAMMLNLGMAEFYEKTVADWADSARDDGMLTDTAPYVGIQYCGVGWAMVHPMLQLKLYQYYGDRRVIERQYDTSRRWLDLVADANPGYIINDGLSDHESLTKTPAEDTLTPLYAESAALLARLARLLDRRDDAAKYALLAERIRSAFAERSLKAASAGGVPPTQTAMSFALQADLVAPSDRTARVQALLADIRGPQNGHLSTGIFGTKFTMDQLSAEGHAQAVFNVIRQETFPGWGYMLANGATTLWEHWALSENTYSNNHPMFGSVSEWFFKWLGGIQPDPDAAGFDRIVIRPQLVDGLQWVRSSYRSIRGDVVSNWSRTGDGTEWQITVPVNATATVYLPVDSLERIKEGRDTLVPVLQAAGVRGGRLDGRHAVLTVGSGAYRFVARPQR